MWSCVDVAQTIVIDLKLSPDIDSVYTLQVGIYTVKVLSCHGCTHVFQHTLYIVVRLCIVDCHSLLWAYPPKLPLDHLIDHLCYKI